MIDEILTIVFIITLPLFNIATIAYYVWEFEIVLMLKKENIKKFKFWDWTFWVLLIIINIVLIYCLIIIVSVLL